ncbi:MAG TPA: EamA family transporter [Anaerolineales bacterium]
MSGIIWAIIAGIGFGLFQVLNRKAGSRIDALRGTFSLLAISAVVLAVASLATEDLALLRRISLVTIFNFAMAGLIHFLLGWTFLTVSQHRVGAARTGALIGAAPLFATVVAALTLNEFLDLPTLIGILLVVGGVYLVSNG